MTVSSTQPVYPPTSGLAIEAVWGDAVAESVIQRFTSAADRDAKWTSPPEGAVCSHDGYLWVRYGGIWRSLATSLQLQDEVNSRLSAFNDNYYEIVSLRHKFTGGRTLITSNNTDGGFSVTFPVPLTGNPPAVTISPGQPSALIYSVMSTSLTGFTAIMFGPSEEDTNWPAELNRTEWIYYTAIIPPAS